MNKSQRTFVADIFDYYETYGRHTLPWRLTHDPYHILVSELMLQQTQVQRVVPKYEAFIAQWPTVDALANASLAEVLIAWQGLGYNRRAKYLLLCAQVVVSEYGSIFPNSRKELEALPGIGPYTAGAILAFAFNQPVVLIETNVRRVYLHHFFADKENISDSQLLPLIEATVSPDNAREWYAALMDYGTYLKQTVPNPNKRSKHYSIQSKFKGSNREIRGAILKVLVTGKMSAQKLYQELGQFEKQRIVEQLKALEKEGMIARIQASYILQG